MEIITVSEEAQKDAQQAVMEHQRQQIELLKGEIAAREGAMERANARVARYEKHIEKLRADIWKVLPLFDKDSLERYEALSRLRREAGEDDCNDL